MPNYMTQAQYSRLKSQLTRAINTKNPHKVLDAVRLFKRTCDEQGLAYPDAWHRWQVAADDAVMALRRDGWTVERVEL